MMQSDDEQLEKGHSVNGNQEADTPTEKKGALGPKLEADYDFFVDVMWANISTKEKQTMTPALVYQVQPSKLACTSCAMMHHCHYRHIIMLHHCHISSMPLC